MNTKSYNGLSSIFIIQHFCANKVFTANVLSAETYMGICSTSQMQDNYKNGII